MITLTMTPDGFFRVEYRLESLQVSVVEARDLQLILTEVENKCRMMRGIHQGKIFTSGTPH